MTGFMALLAVVAPAEAYAEWRVPKYLVGELPIVLAILMTAFLLGILIASGMAARSGSATIRLTPRQVQYLSTTYRVVFILTILGYTIWLASAVTQGVSLNELAGVLNRDEGAIGNLKENSRPIGGVTTMTQFGPVAIAIGFVLRKLGIGGRTYWWIVGLAGFRAMFYAERLALIEVLVPVILIAALTVEPGTRRARWVRAAPVLGVPVIWAIFAVFEYSRSWVYYQWVTPLPFGEWVSLRLAGYYTTSFNNSALMVKAASGTNSLPFFSIDGFWNAPIVAPFWPHPGMAGKTAAEWWAETLRLNANPEFNNTGSFLTTYAEFGILIAAVLWVVLGAIVGAVFTKMTKGSLPALLAVATLFVGLLELSRFLYWTQGRAFPVLLAVVVIALSYPSDKVPLLPGRGRNLRPERRPSVT
ncbi:oligosaccharide repeat unit polymerase [Microbacterium sp. ABRD28]|uniref:oligosaccharide repeat unit polymerase n=1 Tax=Microbacterium sp. ABRD28 TaxID=2268461 RepID=UPI000F553180|nr:oligosaccharide repeat unit polymerase [Microbacterium sp. ABRD28]